MSAGSASAAISPAAGFGFHGVPFNVMRNSKSQHSNSGRLRTFLVSYTPLVVMISISSLRSLMPMNAPSCHLGFQFRLSCTSRSNRHEVHSFSKFNQLSEGTAYQHAIHTPCVRHDQLDTSTSIFHRVFHEKCQNGMSRRSFAFHALFQRTLHHSYLFLYFTHSHFNGTVRLMLFNRTLLHHKFNCGHRPLEPPA